MKHKLLLLLSSCVLLVVVCFSFGRVHDLRIAPVPEPSHRGGYYEEPFTLVLCAPQDGQIYYTTDGSLPTTASILYDGGIRVENRSAEPNLYNSILQVQREWQMYQPDTAPVEKGTVIRAIFVNASGVQSDVFTQTYFVGVQPPEQGYALSLIFEYEDLFGEKGIHVTGEAYDEWYLAGDTSLPEPEPNFMRKREVPVNAEFMDAAGDVLLQQVGLKIQGSSNRLLPKKRFTLTARPEYGSQVFDAPLFEGTATQSLMLKDKLTDAIVADLIPDRAVATQHSVPVRVYLNGEYWYDTYALERYDEQYFRQHYGIEKRLLVKDGLSDAQSDAEEYFDEFEELLHWWRTGDFSDPNEWEKLMDTVDMQSYIDYIVTNYYLGNFDLNNYHNHLMWRSTVSGPSAQADQRYRWCIYDIDTLYAAEGNEEYRSLESFAAIDIFGSQSFALAPNNTLYRAMRQNPEFNRQFVLSFMDMVNNNFAPAHVEQVLAKYGETLDWLDGYFRKRPAYAAEHLAKEFGLTGSLETVTVSCENPEMGSVTVNTSVIDLSGGSWSGQYFTDYPITVTATPRDGYQFVRWEGAESDASITLPVEGGLSLRAVFAPQ